MKGGGNMNNKLLWFVIIVIVLGGGYFLFKGSYPTKQPSTAPTTQTGSMPEVSKNMVTIQSFSFSPATLTVKVGDTVIWKNLDSVGHSATAYDNSFDTGIISPGQTGTATFSKAGTFTYHCGPHPYMKATIIVQ